jgi:hypothetical protein
MQQASEFIIGITASPTRNKPHFFDQQFAQHKKVKQGKQFRGPI